MVKIFFNSFTLLVRYVQCIDIDKNLQLLVQQRFLLSQNKQQETEKPNPKRRVVSMKKSKPIN